MIFCHILDSDSAEMGSALSVFQGRSDAMYLSLYLKDKAQSFISVGQSASTTIHSVNQVLGWALKIQRGKNSPRPHGVYSLVSGQDHIWMISFIQN